ncbi:hypothetical protein LTR27_009712 [Elasticomyces elasticus]|nr:hypothetical protein LTR27_009712 [Elasticomyces elasticus]
MAPAVTFFTLPRELRDLVYEYHFAEGWACRLGHKLQPRQDSDQSCTDTENPIPWPTDYTTARRVCFCNLEDFEILSSCVSKISLLLSNKNICYEASEVFLRQVPVHFMFPGVDPVAFAQRWQHASPAKNVRSIVIEWTMEESEENEDATNATLALLTTTFPAVERVKIIMSLPDNAKRYMTRRYYDVLRKQLPGFRGLKEICIDDEDNERWCREGEAVERGKRPPFLVPTIVNGVRWEACGGRNRGRVRDAYNELMLRRSMDIDCGREV